MNVLSHSSLRRVQLAVLLAAALPGVACAFHGSGVGACAGCHVLHPSQDGTVVLSGGEPLLLAASATDVCLMCHGGDDGVMGHNPVNPPPERGAGNFVFLLEDNINDGADGLTNPIGGAAAGHSIVSADWGLQPDPDWIFAPGGRFPSAQLGCTSCHDPHGNGNYRMLNGEGPVQGGLFDFRYPAPEAVGHGLGDPFATEADDRHTAYLSGMSDWCANCHNRYHEDVGSAPMEHEFNTNLTGQEAHAYNAYEGDADPEGGLASTAYLAEVPFEDPLNQLDGTTGPGPLSRVMCLTCHRAHASSAPRSGRWDFRVRALADDGVVSGSYPLPSPYPDPDQGPLCAKCHHGQMQQAP